MADFYAQIDLSDHTLVGAPGPLPYCIENWSDAEVADLDAMKLDPSFGLAGMGFWPVDVAVPASDPTRQVVVAPTVVDAVDTGARRCRATAIVRAMTADELASVPVPPVSGDAIIGALSKSDAAKVDVRDLARIAYRDDVPVTNAKLGRIAKALGTTPDALRAAATA
jgi:hypothetical protein